MRDLPLHARVSVLVSSLLAVLAGVGLAGWAGLWVLDEVERRRWARRWAARPRAVVTAGLPDLSDLDAQEGP